MIKCATMECDKEMHEAILRMSKMVNIMYATSKWRKEEETQGSESDTSFASSCSFQSSPSSNGEIN